MRSSRMKAWCVAIFAAVGSVRVADAQVMTSALRRDSVSRIALDSMANGSRLGIKDKLDSWFGWWPDERTFTLVDENDALGGSSDSAYTQGIRFRWDFSAWPEAPWFQQAFKWVSLYPLVPEYADNPPEVKCVAKGSRRQRPCGLMHFSLNQTEYTPPELRDPNPNYTTRPYVGYLYGTIGGTVLFPRTSVTSELTIGTIGPRSAARGTQSLAHWTWSWTATEPMGWHNQLKNAWQVTLRNAYANELLEFCVHGCTTGTRDDGRIFDIVPNGELVLGTLMRRGSIGTTAHLGYGFPDLITPFRIATTAPPMLTDPNWLDEIEDFIVRGWRSSWFLVFASYDRRYVETNDLLTGSHNDGGPNGWRTLRQINLERDIGEYAWGFTVGIERLTFGWQQVTRTAEYRPGGGPHRFGVITFGIFTAE
jgi:hypothetical protein